MSPRTISITAAVAAVIMFIVCAAIGTIALGGQAAIDCAPAQTTSSLPSASHVTARPPGGYPRIGRWDPTQVGNAATIITVGARRGVPARGWVIAVATAMQESSLQNLSDGDRDSVGLFQQRPSQGWGTPTQLQDLIYASTRFYAKLVTVAGWQTMPLAEAAQSVQNSGDGGLYADDETDARTVVQRLTGTAGTQDCDVAVGPQGWVAPVKARIVSGYRTPDRPNHQGVDLGAARGTNIHAAAAGAVTIAECNVKPASHGCDRDGSTEIKGCGWYVQLDHGAGVGTVYCHMLRRPSVAVGQRVAAGQTIGIVGSSGNSSGDHLHYEVLVHGVETDPVAWMRSREAPLGNG
ncbi:MAG TPA: M23 family metallopeptidase [Mycobacterium sp.]|nr:M23 family metallopeptidase [Mycobacterium sp.]